MKQVSSNNNIFKKIMRENEAIYGGEMPAYHYFCESANCDSDMIPWLLAAELVPKSGRSFGARFKDSFTAYPSSAEINFCVKDAPTETVLAKYSSDAISFNKTDGVSLTFDTWRFNLLRSNAGPLLPPNIETRGDEAENKTKVLVNTDLIDV
tara:strand:- start:5331 stop:5786 length:456 start_codon:yes stop_codon:yes gene_type:complete